MIRDSQTRAPSRCSATLGARLNRLLHEALYGRSRNRCLAGNLRPLSALLALVGNAIRAAC